MNLFSLVVIAVGLAMDAFSVSIVEGVRLREVKVKHAGIIAIFFGGFQAFMPLIGWFIGERVSSYIVNSAHWIAFVLMLLLGGRMIYESIRAVEESENDKDTIKIKSLIVMAIATSIDALLVGFTLALFDIPLFLIVSIIGVITFIFCFFGVFLGNKIGNYLGRYATLIGGIILIGIGIFMLWEGM